MSETKRNFMSADAAAELAAFSVRPPLRCFHRVEGAPGRTCERAATRRRPGDWPIGFAFYCAEHARGSDQPILPGDVFRRVSITAELLFSGTSYDGATATAEAVGRLERAVEAAGGVINLHSARTAIGAVRPTTPARREHGDGGRLSG